MSQAERIEIWRRVEAELDRGMPKWKERIASMEQLEAVERRQAGQSWTNHQVFEGLVLSVLTSSVDWSRIESIRHELKDLFAGFDPIAYAKLSPDDVSNVLVPWFKERKAGALNHRQNFILLIEAANRLNSESINGSADVYIRRLFEECEGQPIRLALKLGSYKSPHKLPGVGIALAAEFLKNLGYDAAKPDRHICRAVGAFGWVNFKNWPDDTGNKPPTPSEAEMVDVMKALEDLAGAVGERATLVDNALWLLCAKSGRGSSNEALRQLASIAEGRMGEGGNASRRDRFAWSAEDTIPISNEQFEAAPDRMYGKGIRPYKVKEKGTEPEETSKG